MAQDRAQRSPAPAPAAVPTGEAEAAIALPELYVRGRARGLWSDAFHRLLKNRLAVIGAVIILLFTIAAVRRNSALDYLSVGFATLGASTPNFVLGIMLVILFAVKLHWLPAVGWSNGITDWKPAVLPVISLGSLPAAYIARITRASMLEVMNQDYIRTARAKGLRERVITLRHIVRNALIPVLTLIGPISAGLLTGSFVIEYFFSIPGIGRAYVQAILGRDYPMIMATTLLYATIIVIANLVVDLLYAVVDPRIRYS